MICEHLTQALGNLLADTAIAIDSITPTEDYRIISTLLGAHITGLTANEGEGLQLYIADGELSVAEVKACIETDGPLDRNDNARDEAAHRKVQLLGQFVPGVATTSGSFRGSDGGPIIKEKVMWTFGNDDGWQFVVYNSGSNLTTGAACTVVATQFGVWVT